MKYEDYRIINEEEEALLKLEFAKTEKLNETKADALNEIKTEAELKKEKAVNSAAEFESKTITEPKIEFETKFAEPKIDPIKTNIKYNKDNIIQTALDGSGFILALLTSLIEARENNIALNELLSAMSEISELNFFLTKNYAKKPSMIINKKALPTHASDIRKAIIKFGLSLVSSLIKLSEITENGQNKQEITKYILKLLENLKKIC